MSKDMQKLQRIAFKSFREVLSDGYVLFVKNWLNFIGPFAFFCIISLIVKDFILTDLVWNVNSLNSTVDTILNKITIDPNSVTQSEYQILMQYIGLTLIILILDSLFGAFFTTLAMCLIGNYLYKKYLEENTKIGNEFKFLFNYKLFLVLLLIGIAIPLGSLLLFIPAILILGYYIFAIYTYQSVEIERPFKEARIIAKGAFWKIIGIFLLSSLITLIINIFFQFLLDITLNINSTTNLSWYNPSTRNYGMIFLYDLLYYQLIYILLGPIFVCFLTVLFTSLKIKKDLGFRYQKGYYPESYSYEEQVGPYSVSENRELTHQNLERKFESGLYCPFCGNFMKEKFNNCPNCGESLDFKL